MTPPLTRRSFLAGTAGLMGAAALGATAGPAARAAARAAAASAAGTATGPAPTAAQAAALRVLGRTTLRQPGSLPFPKLPPGTDTMPEIESIVVLMLENHSYDNLFGMLGRGRGQKPRGDGFTLDRHGNPTATNPYPDGRIQHAFHMPTTCQLSSKPSQEWKACHVQYAGGRNNGFVASDSGPVAMGYWTGADLPLTYSLAETFPVGDRWFSSVLGQTDPQRRYLVAATSAGMTDDIGTGPGSASQDALLGSPTVTIFNRLDAAGIHWTNYVDSYPLGATPNLYPATDGNTEKANMKPFSAFYTDAAAGKLPPFSLLDPNYNTQSQENPQNLVLGEAVLAQVVHAIGASPQWRKTLFIFTYDEHGGYYDHVPPPVALAPDSIAPVVNAGESTYDGFARYGFRVPSVVVSPYARKNYVTHVVHDHTSILATVERKWNLAALTYRDANANDVTDFLDIGAMTARRPTFPTLPRLAASGDTAKARACTQTGPGTIPPKGSVSR